MAQQEQRLEGLQSVKEGFDLMPQWTIEPNLESMKYMIEEDRQSQGQEVVVSSLANCKGLLNKSTTSRLAVKPPSCVCLYQLTLSIRH
jgi:hypothetical protein